jgi:sugar phosphate isomerase/epimerase
MGFSGFGYTVEDLGSPDQLDQQLAAVAESGYSHAEIDPHYWDVWVGGRVMEPVLARFETVIARHRDRLRFTMHGPFDANLFEPEDRAAHERLLRASLEVAGELGVETVVFHPGFRPEPPYGLTTAMLDLMRRERETLRGLAEEAHVRGTKIALETWFSRGVPGYSYANWPDQLAGQVEQIGHPALGVCVDFGHLAMSAHWYGFDYLAGVRRLAPLTTHFHLQDLTGIPEHASASSTLGRGDLHLPPGWGTLPFDDVFSQVDFPREPVFNVEIWGTRFLPYRDSILVEMRRLAALRDAAGRLQ